MRRRLITIVILLLAGAVVNVAVAWGSAALVREQQAQAEWALVRGPDNQGTTEIVVAVWSRFGADRVIGLWQDFLGPNSTEPEIDYWVAARRFRDNLNGAGRAARPPRWAADFPYHEDYPPEFSIHDARGWPLRTLRCRFHTSYAPPFGYVTVGGIELAPKSRFAHWWFKPRALPLRPIWPNFGLITILYALILWLLIRALLALRQLVRRRRGLCPACAYPIGDSPVCTECGNPARNIAVA